MLIESMALLHDFVKVKCPCGAMWRGSMVSPTTYMDSTRRKKERFFLSMKMHNCVAPCMLHKIQSLTTIKKKNGFLGSSF